MKFSSMISTMFNKFLSLTLAGLLVSQGLWAELYAPPSAGPDSTAPTKKAELGQVFGSQDMGGPVNYAAFDVSDHTAKNAGLRSALFPGWGQLFNGETRKGILMSSVAAVLMVSAFATYNDAGNSYDDYTSSGRKDSSLYSDYSNKLTLTWALAGAYAVLLGASVRDASRRANRTAQAHHVQFVFSENGDGSVVVRRQF